MAMVRGTPEDACKPIRADASEMVITAVPMALLVLLGLWMPLPLRAALSQAAAIVRPLP
jgi:hypothetical protein